MSQERLLQWKPTYAHAWEASGEGNRHYTIEILDDGTALLRRSIAGVGKPLASARHKNIKELLVIADGFEYDSRMSLGTGVARAQQHGKLPPHEN